MKRKSAFTAAEVKQQAMSRGAPQSALDTVCMVPTAGPNGTMTSCIEGEFQGMSNMR